MSMRVVAPAIAVLVAVGVAAYQWMDLRAQRVHEVELSARVAALEAGQAAARARPPDPPATLPAVPPESTPAVNAQPGVAVAAAPAAAGGQPKPAASVLEVLDSPQGRDFATNMMRGLMAQMYPDIEAELGITAQEAQQLFELLTKQGQGSVGLLTTSDPAARQQMQRKLVEDMRMHEREVEALLGSRYPKWEEYQSAANARQQVDQLRSALAGSGHPLSEAQSKALVTAFTRELADMQKSEREWIASPKALESPNVLQETMARAAETPRKLARAASPHLTTAQAEQYERQVEQQEGVLRATMGMLGAQGEAP